MRRGHDKRWLRALCGIAGLFCAGCDEGDVDRLGRVWHCLCCRGKEWSGGARRKLSSGWSAMQTQINSPDVLREHVTTRLQLDKALANAAIEVEVEGAVVTVRGEVADPATRQRAVELARETIGVEQVIDELGPKE